ncbi:ammonium transporter [Nocardioides jishulii]|uniref:Ammonium transporter n=2 Tax=Nocardioides jishulii TaxID=2575440 RepID=A0A4U2YM21_9ACTN|nr:ammonium transporter [Nocardioides jishulii]TKI61874.1 ammonium transporter [Nocardioides jishulii]
MLVSASFVLMMTTPALALFYGGMSRSKSVLNMMMMSFSSVGIVGIVYVLWGYSMSYSTNEAGESTSVLGLFANPFEWFGLEGYDPSGYIGVGFQLTFAVITAALISGAVADRLKFSAWVLFLPLWVTFSYFPLAHMVWGGGLLSGEEESLAAWMFGVTDGMASVAPVDYAGGTVVHINAGVAGLILALMLGKRLGFGKEPIKPHNLPLTMIGAGLLWLGWYGFNVGSIVFPADGTEESNALFIAETGLVWLNTTVAAAAAVVGWMVVEKIRHGKATSLGAASGVVAGLVAITPACGALSPIGAIILGLVSGALCALAVGLKYKFGYDDALDVVGVHLVGGLVGTVGIGFLATSGGLFYGDGAKLLVVQVVIALFAMLWSAVFTFLVALLVKAVIGLRVDEEAEIEGVDFSEHGETAYDFGTAVGRGRSLVGNTTTDKVKEGASA